MSGKILVVDDDACIRKLLTVNLSAEGYEVVTAENGTEALEYLSQNHADLIILDIMMPETDGWEVCKAIRDEEYETRQRILMLTARDTARDKLIGKELLHADEYVTKPFDIDELLKLIDKMLAN